MEVLKMYLREARFKKGLTQFDLRIKTGIHQSRISLLERGYYEPRAEEIEKLARALSIPANELEFKNPLA
jgi:transcriptional regulator with XRE-family HTH domain